MSGWGTPMDWCADRNAPVEPQRLREALLEKMADPEMGLAIGATAEEVKRYIG